MPNIFGLILTCVIVVIVFSLLLFLIKRYKKCPSDKVMVIYGKVGSNKDGSTRSAKCIHGGAAFIWPVIQSYEFLDLTPMSISVDLENALSRQNIRINVPSRFTVGVSTEPGVMQNAAEPPAGPEAPGDPGAGQGHHLRPAPPGHRHYGHRGDQHRPG